MEVEDLMPPEFDFGDWTEEDLRKSEMEIDRVKYVCAALQRYLDKGGRNTKRERQRVVRKAVAKWRPGARPPLSSLSDPGDGPAN